MNPLKNWFRQPYGQKQPIERSIREAIDTLPGGICFATAEGRPVLVNRRMNALVFSLTGHTVMNARAVWEELARISTTNGCDRLDGELPADADEDTLLFALPDGNVWRFRRETLTDRLPHYVQLEATDISLLYRHSKNLYENNRRLGQQYERQQTLLADIVEINREKELLAMKMRIHDDLGRSILTTKQHLLNHTLEENSAYLEEIWSSTIRKLSDFGENRERAELSPEVELLRAADMIGCTIDFRGERPQSRKTLLLLFTFVREALTNAVRHANADRLSVAITPTGRGYHVEISDNGARPVTGITEGNGLGNLRRRLEQEGATLEIKCVGGVVLTAEMPAQEVC